MASRRSRKPLPPVLDDVGLLDAMQMAAPFDSPVQTLSLPMTISGVWADGVPREPSPYDRVMAAFADGAVSPMCIWCDGGVEYYGDVRVTRDEAGVYAVHPVTRLRRRLSGLTLDPARLPA